jgi:hypothetical protein
MSNDIRTSAHSRRFGVAATGKHDIFVVPWEGQALDLHYITD